MTPAWTVQRATFTPGALDGHGNPVDAWGAAVDVLVYGWSPPTADTVDLDNRDMVSRLLDVYAPAGTTGSPQDRWTVNGATYDQQGWPEDFNHGPFGWAPGVRINLRRVEG